MSNKPLSQYKEKEKKEEYHKRYLDKCLDECLDTNAVRKELMATCYNYFHGTQVNPMNQLIDAFDIKGTRTNPQDRLNIPVLHMNVNKIKPKVQTLMGELIDLGFEASVEAINEEAKAAKLQYRNEMLGLMTVRSKVSEIDKLFGIEDDSLPESIEALENFMKADYKENSEIVLEACLKYSLAYNTYLMIRLQFFMDVIIAGECHAKNRMQQGFPVIERINPLNGYYPTNLNDNEYLEKTYQFCHIYYATKSEVIEKYGVTPEELQKDVEESLSGNVDGAWYGKTINGRTAFMPYDQNNQELILVVEAEWMDNKPERVTVAQLKDGIEDVIVRHGEQAENYKVNKSRWEKKGKKLIEDTTREVSTLRKAVRIGCNLIKDWGEVEAQPLSPTSWSTCEKSVTSYRPYYIQGQSKSMVMDVMNLQDFIEYLWTKIQLEATKSSGKVLVINLKAIPKQFGANPSEAISKVLHYLKGYNIVFRDAEQEELGADASQGLPVSEVDMGLSNSITAFFQLLQLTDTEIDTITGLNQARMGEIANNQLKSVTAMMLNQSSKQTKHIVNGFLQFESRLLTKHAQQIKYSWWMYPKAWSTAIGDVYYAFMEATRDISMDTHMIKVSNDTVSKQELKEYMMASIQSGSMQPHDALAIEMTAKDSIKEAVRKYINKMEKQAEQAMQMQQQQSEAQQAMQQQALEAKMGQTQLQNQGKVESDRTKGEYQLQKQAMRDQTDMQKSMEQKAMGQMQPM